MAKVTMELQDAVRNNPKIENVYFDAKGNHFYNKHTVELHTDDGKGHSEKMEKVDSLPGVSSGILEVKQGNGKMLAKRVTTGITPIAETMSRKDVLDAKPVANKDMSEKQEDDIIRLAQEIIKKRAGVLAVLDAEVPDYDEETYADYKKNFNDMPVEDVIAHFKVVSSAKGKNKSKFCDEERKALNEVIAEKNCQ